MGLSPEDQSSNLLRRLTLHAGLNVAVRPQRDPDCGVPQLLLHHLRMHPGLQRVGAGNVIGGLSGSRFGSVVPVGVAKRVGQAFG